MNLEHALFSSTGLGLCALLALSACDADRSRPASADGADMTVLALANSPTLTVGLTDADALTRVRGVTTARGQLAIANAGTSEILIVDSAGALVRRIGGDGDGPGEFRRLTAVEHIRGDSLLAFDSGLQRFSVFAPDGRYVRAFPPGGVGGDQPRGLSVVGVVEDSIVVLQSVRLGAVSEPASGTSRALIDILRMRLMGELVDTVAVVEGWEAYSMTAVGLGNVPVPFGRSSVIDAAADRILIALSDSNVVRVYGSDGTLVRSIRSPAPEGAPVTAADIAADKERVLGNAPPQMRQRLAALYEQVPIPDTKPPFTFVHAGTDGTVWLRTHASDDEHHFLVFPPDGRMSAEATLPLAFSISEIDLREAVGVWTDSLGVETVRRYAVRQVGR